MRAFLIDPGARTITPVEYDGDYKSIYKLIDADTFAATNFNDGADTVYVDDEGLMKGPTDFFLIEGYPQPLAGKGLVIGTDAEGSDIEPTVTLDWLQQNTDFGQPMKIGSVLMFMGERNVREVQA